MSRTRDRSSSSRSSPQASAKASAASGSPRGSRPTAAPAAPALKKKAAKPPASGPSAKAGERRAAPGEPAAPGRPAPDAEQLKRRGRPPQAEKAGETRKTGSGAEPAAVLDGPPAGPGPSPAPSQDALDLARLADRLARIADLLEERFSAPPALPPQEPELGGDERRQEALEEIAASLRRAMSEAIDRRLEELLAPLAALHFRLSEEAQALAADPASVSAGDLEAFLTDGARELEKVLRSAGGSFITPSVGESYDPLIHLAVSEAPGSGEEEGTVAEVLRPGYRSGRGRVLLPARVIARR